MTLEFELVRHILGNESEWTCTLASPLESVESPRCRLCGHRCRSALVSYQRATLASGSLRGRMISCSECSATDLLDDMGDTLFSGELRVRAGNDQET